MNTRRFLLFVTCWLMCLTTGAEDCPAYNAIVDGIYYYVRSIDGKNVAYVTCKNLCSDSGFGGFYDVVSDYSGSVVIPSQISYKGITYSVTGINRCAFYNCSRLTSVTIPESVASIGDYAFYNCSRLTSVTIPESVTSIGDKAFYDCSGLTSVTIPNCVTYIGSSAFDNTAWYSNQPDGLVYVGKVAYRYKGKMSPNTSFTIKEGTLGIGDKAFSDCSGLTSVTIPESVTSIYGYAFFQCVDLTSITIPNSVTSIREKAFSGCFRLTSVTIGNSVTSISKDAFYGCRGVKSATIYSKDCLTLLNNFQQNLENIEIGGDISTIESSLLSGFKNIKTITLGNFMSKIGERSFANIDKLTDVTIYATEVPETDRTAFENSYIEDYVTLHVPVGCVEKYKAVAPWKNFKNIQEITDNLYTLTYMVDGEVYKTYQIYEGRDVTLEPNPKKDGFSFSGWSEIPEKMPDHDVTVTGTFKKGDYVLTYMVDNEKYKTVNYDQGEKIEPEPAPTKEGYSFSGWEGIPETMPDNDVTATGTFTINKYKLTYMVDGEVYKSYEIKYGSTITPLDEPTKEGYIFSGWSEIPEEMPAHDVTVTGTFIKDPLGTCAAPTISVVGGKLTFACETEGVTYHYDVSCTYEKSGEGNNIDLQTVYKVSVYASKDGFVNSETVAKDIKLDNAAKGSGDSNGDGVVNAADIVTIVNTIMQGGQ